MPLIPTKIRMASYRVLGAKLHPTAILASKVFLGSPKLIMSKDSFINHGCFLDTSEYITLGDNVRIGPRVTILTSTHTYAHNVMRRGPGSINLKKSVVIENGVWIGTGSIILPGILIREGCIIAAGSVIINSTEPNGLYAGNPGRRLKDLPIEQV